MIQSAHVSSRKSVAFDTRGKRTIATLEPAGAPEGRTPETGAPPSSPVVEEPKLDPKAERIAALTMAGDLAASKGQKALKDWLDDLSGDDSALITPSLTKRWSAAAAKP